MLGAAYARIFVFPSFQQAYTSAGVHWPEFRGQSEASHFFPPHFGVLSWGELPYLPRHFVSFSVLTVASQYRTYWRSRLGRPCVRTVRDHALLTRPASCRRVISAVGRIAKVLRPWLQHIAKWRAASAVFSRTGATQLLEVLRCFSCLAPSFSKTGELYLLKYWPIMALKLIFWRFRTHVYGRLVFIRNDFETWPMPFSWAILWVFGLT